LILLMRGVVMTCQAPSYGRAAASGIRAAGSRLPRSAVRPRPAIAGLSAGKRAARSVSVKARGQRLIP